MVLGRLLTPASDSYRSIQPPYRKSRSAPEGARSTDISASLALPQGQEVPQNVTPERRGRRAPERRVRMIPVYRNLDPVAANNGDRGQVDGAIRYRVSTTDALAT